MKTLTLLLCLMVAAPYSLRAQSKGEMPFTGSPEANKLLRKSWVALADFNTEEANTYTRQVLAQAPDMGMAYASLFSNDPEEVTSNLLKAEESKLSPDELLFIQGVLARRSNQSPQQYFDPLLKKYPKDLYLQFWILFNFNDPKRSIEIGESIIKRNPKFAPVYNLLGYLYMGEQDMIKAETHFDKYIALQPNLANPYDSKGDYYMRGKKYAQAIPMYEKALAMGMKVSATKLARAKAMIKWPSPSDENRTKANSIITSSVSGYEKGNVDAILSDYSEHAIKVWGNQVATVGQAGVRVNLNRMVRNFPYSKFEGSVRPIQGAGPIAVSLGTVKSVRSQPDGKETNRIENVAYLLRKDSNDNFKILLDHFYEDKGEVFQDEDSLAIHKLIDDWNKALIPGEPNTEAHLENLGALYSAQAIEVFGDQTSNIGLPNIRARWIGFLGTKMARNSLGVIGVDGLGKRAVAWGIANQNYYVKDSDELREFEFPWAMILTKEKDNQWRILVLHWGAG